jgi:hypothetical protein
VILIPERLGGSAIHFRGINVIQPGRYRHYKGKDYTVIGMALHSETREELVVYRQEYGDHRLWVRPKLMFVESVEIDGKVTPRFEYIGPLA